MRGKLILIKPCQFSIHSIYDVENIYSLRCKLDLSQSQMYNVLHDCEIPFYHLPNCRSCTLLHGATLWKIAKSAAFKKYMYKLDFNERYGRSIKINEKDHQKTGDYFGDDYGISILYTKAIKTGVLDLSIEKAISAIKAGLLPCDDKETGVLASWFVMFLKGKLEYPLPKKIKAIK